MTSRKKIALYAIACAILLFVGCNALIAPLVYFAKPFGGRVIDKETGTIELRPVAIARWRDDTAAIVARHQIGYTAPLHLLREPVAGKSRAIARALAAASGDILAFTDDDVNVEVGVASCCNCGDTRLISRIGVDADQSAGRDRKTVTAVRAGAGGSGALS